VEPDALHFAAEGKRFGFVLGHLDDVWEILKGSEDLEPILLSMSRNLRVPVSSISLQENAGLPYTQYYSESSMKDAEFVRER